MTFKILLVILLIFLPVNLTGVEGVDASADIERELNLSLGEGSAEIADIIQDYLKTQPPFLVVYEAMNIAEFDEEVVSTIMFFIEEGDDLKFYNLPLRTFLPVEEAEKITDFLVDTDDFDHLRVNLGYFIEVIDLFGGIEVYTADGYIEMDSEDAENYLIYGLEDYGSYPYDHRERQELLMLALIEKMDQTDGIPSITNALSILYNGIQKIESNLSFLGKARLGIRLMNYGFENIEFYQPEPEMY